MSGQRFYADPRATFQWPNGAIGHRPCPGGFDSLGPYAKVVNCPIHGTTLRRTCYATWYADTYFSVPAVCTIGGKRVTGYFSMEDDNIVFRVMDKHKEHVLTTWLRGNVKLAA